MNYKDTTDHNDIYGSKYCSHNNMDKECKEYEHDKEGISNWAQWTLDSYCITLIMWLSIRGVYYFIVPKSKLENSSIDKNRILVNPIILDKSFRNELLLILYNNIEFNQSLYTLFTHSFQ